MLLGHGVFGAMEDVEDEAAEEGEADLSGHGQFLFPLVIDQEDAFAGRVACEVDILPDFDEPVGAQDKASSVAPAAESVGGEPIDTAV